MPHTSSERHLLPASSDLAREVAALIDADLLRLGALARLRARGLPGLDGADLLNEAVLRLLDGSRSRPPDVPLVAVLAMTMRGVAHDHWRSLRRERPVMVQATDDADAARLADAFERRGGTDVTRLHRRAPQAGDKVWLDGGDWCLTVG